MCQLSQNKKACNLVTQHPLAMGGVLCLMDGNWGRDKDPGTGREAGCVCVCVYVCVCGVVCGVQCVYGTQISWLLEEANHLDSVQAHCLDLVSFRAASLLYKRYNKNYVYQ